MPFAAKRSSSPALQIDKILRKSSNYDGVRRRVAADFGGSHFPTTDTPLHEAGILYGYELDCEQPKDWKHPHCAMNDLNLLEGQMYQMEQEVNKQVVAKPSLAKTEPYLSWVSHVLLYREWRDKIRPRIVQKQENVDFLEGEVDDESEDATPERIEIRQKRDQYTDFRRRLATVGFKFASGPKQEKIKTEETLSGTLDSAKTLILLVGGLYIAREVFSALKAR